MRINIKLQNSKYCDDCPCLSCEIEYCQYYKEHLKLVDCFHTARCKKCIKQNVNE